MATSFNVNLTITSAVGFRRSSTQTFINFAGTPTVGGINGPRPVMTTTFTLNGVSQPDISISGTKILNVSTTTVFYLYPGGTSDEQSIYITNEGNSALSLVSPYFITSENGVNANIVDIEPSSGVIGPGSTGSVTVSYSGNESGDFYNFIIILTDADSPQYKVVTRQIVTDQLTFTVSPLSYSASSTTTGFKTTATYTISPIFNGVSSPELLVPVSATLSTTATGWTLLSNENNSVSVFFNGNRVNNATGTWVSTLTVSYGIVSYSLINSVNLNVDYSDDYNLGSWISAPSPYDSIIGASYDVIDDVKHLTIGVGAAGDGKPLYGLGGSEFLTITNLNYIAADSDEPYKYWGKVFRIPLHDTPGNRPKTYYSKDYLVKNQGPEYVSYFGENLAPGSMFIIEDDGYHNVTVKINHIRELPPSNVDAVTVSNLSRAFHYYSGVDQGGGRYYQLENILPDGNSTHLFVGFNNQGGVIRFPVDLPTL